MRDNNSTTATRRSPEQRDFTRVLRLGTLTAFLLPATGLSAQVVAAAVLAVVAVSWAAGYRYPIPSPRNTVATTDPQDMRWVANATLGIAVVTPALLVVAVASLVAADLAFLAGVAGAAAVFLAGFTRWWRGIDNAISES